MAEHHPIFNDIERGNLAAVKRRVLANDAALEERGPSRRTPLIQALCQRQPAIALWLIEHRGRHDVNTRDADDSTALHWACSDGPLSAVRALVAAGANPALVSDDEYSRKWTPLMYASEQGHADIVAFLLKVPAAKATIDVIDYHESALNVAISTGHTSIVQLLLEAGADPTIPRWRKPLNQAKHCDDSRTEIVALLRGAVFEPNRARALFKCYSILHAPTVIDKAVQNAHDKRLPATEHQCAVLRVTPRYLKERIAWGYTLPRVKLTPQRQQQGDDERLRATAAFVLGLEEGGVEYEGLPNELFLKLMGYLMPAWADTGRKRDYTRDAGSDSDTDVDRY